MPTKPVASLKDSDDLNGRTLHRLQDSQSHTIHAKRGLPLPRYCWPTPAMPRGVALERWTRSFIDAVVQHVGTHDPAGRGR